VSDQNPEAAVYGGTPGVFKQIQRGPSLSERVADALTALWTLYPGIRDRVADEQGQLRQHINIFVGREHIRYTGGLATPLSEESEVSIVPAVSGG